MELSGTVAANLRRAIDSVRRHEGKPVYPETTRYWRDLLVHARDKAGGDSRLIETLEVALSQRGGIEIGHHGSQLSSSVR